MTDQSPADELQALEERLGYAFRERSLLESALAHASMLPAGAVRVSEQLEFLGDAVLGLAIAERLLGEYPKFDEGKLSKARALLVCASTLAAKARELGLDHAVRLGRGEERSGGRNKDSILAATYEAVIGAVFRDGGFGPARALVGRHFQTEIEDGAVRVERDWKTTLQERSQAELRIVPEYTIVEERGPAHAREFVAEVSVAGRPLARGAGSSKRESEQQAARAALQGTPDLGAD